MTPKAPPMSTGGPYPPAMEGDAEEMGEMGATAGEVCVPLKALAQPDDAEKMNTPEMNDPVSFQVDGVITRIEGENAYIKPMSVNGTSLDEEKGEPTPEELDAQEGESLREEATQM